MHAARLGRGHLGPRDRLNGVLARITEPVIAPVRRLVRPVGVGGVGLDLSFIIVVLVAQLVAAQLRNYALG